MPSRTHRPATGRRRPRVVPDDACPTCGTMMDKKCGTVTSSVNGEAVRVPNIPHLRCPKCGEGMFTLDELRTLRLGAFAIYRRKHRLLGAEQVRAIRDVPGSLAYLRGNAADPCAASPARSPKGAARRLLDAERAER